MRKDYSESRLRSPSSRTSSNNLSGRTSRGPRLRRRKRREKKRTSRVALVRLLTVWLVLSDATDDSARWAFEGLRMRGLTPIDFVTCDDLAHARWVHYVGKRGALIEMRLRDG